MVLSSKIGVRQACNTFPVLIENAPKLGGGVYVSNDEGSWQLNGLSDCNAVR